MGHHQSPTPSPLLLRFTSLPTLPQGTPAALSCLWAVQARGCLLWDRSHTATQPKEDIVATASWEVTDELPVKMYMPLEVMHDLKECYGQRLAGLTCIQQSYPNWMNLMLSSEYVFPLAQRLFFICIPILFPLLITLYFLSTSNLAASVKGSRRPQITPTYGQSCKHDLLQRRAHTARTRPVQRCRTHTYIFTDSSDLSSLTQHT